MNRMRIVTTALLAVGMGGSMLMPMAAQARPDYRHDRGGISVVLGVAPFVPVVVPEVVITDTSGPWYGGHRYSRDDHRDNRGDHRR
jgi:hypothetical protein